jgi:hypothetical protein
VYRFATDHWKGEKFGQFETLAMSWFTRLATYLNSSSDRGYVEILLIQKLDIIWSSLNFAFAKVDHDILLSILLLDLIA